MQKDLQTAIKITGKLADNWLPLKIKYDETPGCVVGIAVNGVLKYHQAFGVSDMAKGSPMKKDAQFRVASMSKMFTAVAIMQLKEKGKLRLDDTAYSHLKWFKGKSGVTDLKNVTIRQLLSHNAGLFRDGTAKQWFNDRFPKKVASSISGQAIVFENGTTLKYSNHGYAVLGAIIEKVTNQSYAAYVTKHIIKPLKLTGTLPELPDTLPPKLVKGYSGWFPDTERVIEPNIKTHAYASATGFISNVKDLAVFLATLHPDSKKSVISRESRKEMMHPQGRIEEGEFYGLGLELCEHSGQDTYGHGGGFAGYSTNANGTREDNIQVIVLTNTKCSTSFNVGFGLIRAIYAFKNMSGVKYVAKESYSGTYRNRWGDTTVVALGNKVVDFFPGTNNPVEGWSVSDKQKQHVFKNTDTYGIGTAGETLTFKQIKNGQAQTLATNVADSERVCYGS